MSEPEPPRSRRRLPTAAVWAIDLAVGALLAVVVIVVVNHVRDRDTGVPAPIPTTATTEAAHTHQEPLTIDPTHTYVARVDTEFGSFEITLDARRFPKSTNRFVTLARSHFYDGLTWHRVVHDFVVQGGDPKGDGTGGPGSTIETETPKLPYRIADVAWARAPGEPPAAAGSQFFVLTGTEGAALPTEYGYIGHVTAGLDVVERLNALARPGDESGRPTRTVHMTTITIVEH
jgi:cyclophilin family peptidyl-prolyl cis-trans isomerase